MNQLDVQKAVAILKEYSCVNIKPVVSETEKQQLQQAILLISSLSDYENIGVCADNVHQGFSALDSYLKALGYQTQLAPVKLENDPPVYIKFNTQKLNYYLDVYEGSYRGVLISYRGENAEFTGTYGYFPLNLFIL